MATYKTKQQEREALARITEILDEFGPDSYIGMAFAGCLQAASDNIEFDFGNSPAVDNARAAEKAKAEAEELRKRAEAAEREAAALAEQLAALRAVQITIDEAEAAEAIIIDARDVAVKRRDELARLIVEHADTPTLPEFVSTVNLHRLKAARVAECDHLIERFAALGLHAGEEVR